MAASQKVVARFVVAAWFIFSLSGQSIVEEARLVSTNPYESREACVDAARLLQGPNLLPFYYCVGSEKVSELPPQIGQRHILSFEEKGGRR